MIKFKYLLPLIIIPFFVGCQLNIAYVKHDKEISVDVKKSIWNIDSLINLDLIQKKTDYLKSIIHTNIDVAIVNSFDSIEKYILFKPGAHIHHIGDYYVVNSETSNIDKVSSYQLGDLNYRFSFTSIGRETFVSLFTIKAIADGNEWLISTVFTKENNDWKLINFQIGPFMYKYMQAPMWYKMSVAELDSANYIKAMLKMHIAMAYAFPAADSFHYQIENQMINYISKLNMALSNAYSFPINIDSTKNSAKLLKLDVGVFHEEIYPVILYKTGVRDINSLTMNEECEKVNAKINRLLPGVKEVTDTIVYKVVSDKPNEISPIYEFRRNNR